MKAALSTAALVALALLPEPAYAPPLMPQCDARQVMLDNLKKRYDEVVVSMGVADAGGLIEITASPTGSWSMLVTVPGGRTCMVSSGTGWRTIAKKKRDTAV